VSTVVSIYVRPVRQAVGFAAVGLFLCALLLPSTGSATFWSHGLSAIGLFAASLAGRPSR
jgi:hypothetical protein